MLIDFTVQNFRSVKDPVTLSAIAQVHQRNQKDARIAEPWNFRNNRLSILPTIGIFGPNASGKSNVIRALANLFSFLYFGGIPEKIDHFSRLADPFRLDSETIYE